MSCYRPIKAVKTPGGEIVLWSRGDGYALELPCGRCIGCKMDRRRMWSVRIQHEAQLYVSNWFLTFTYDDGKKLVDPSLDYKDFQAFMKRLRARLKGEVEAPDGRRPIRFFCAGEYGGKTFRPHYHAILFNVVFKDLESYVNGTFRSKIAEDLWGSGNVVIGNVSAQSASYVAGYTMKKVHGADARAHYEDVVNVRTGELSSRRPEFVVMSRKPGIGTWWYEKYWQDLFPGDQAVSDGKCWKVPRFYWEKFKEMADPAVVEEVEYARYLKAAENLEESTEARRVVKEERAERMSAMFEDRGL